MSEKTKVTLELELTEEEIKSFHIKCGSVGMKMTEIMENFIADLTYSDRSNGSDECMYANDWLNRCGFAMFPEKTLLRYLLESEQMDELLKTIDYILCDKSCKDTIEEELSNPDNDWENIVTITGGECYQTYHSKAEWEAEQRNALVNIVDSIQSEQQEINEIWNEYLAWAGTADIGTFEDAMKAVHAWRSELPELEV